MHLSSPFPLRSWGERVCTAYFVISAYKHIVQCKRRHLKVALRGGLLINFHAVQSSLKIKLIRDGHFGAVKGQTNKRTHSHTHTHKLTDILLLQRMLMNISTLVYILNIIIRCKLSFYLLKINTLIKVCAFSNISSNVMKYHKQYYGDRLRFLITY